MSHHDPSLNAATAPDPIRDGTVACLRRWTDCPDLTLLAFADLYGDRACPVLLSFRPFATTLSRYGCRLFMRHAPGCPCRGADETALAHLVACAAAQQREKALLVAMSIVRPDFAPVLVAQAEALGLTLYSEHIGADRATHRPTSRWLN